MKIERVSKIWCCVLNRVNHLITWPILRFNLVFLVDLGLVECFAAFVWQFSAVDLCRILISLAFLVELRFPFWFSGKYLVFWGRSKVFLQLVFAYLIMNNLLLLLIREILYNLPRTDRLRTWLSSLYRKMFYTYVISLLFCCKDKLRDARMWLMR